MSSHAALLVRRAGTVHSLTAVIGGIGPSCTAEAIVGVLGICSSATITITDNEEGREDIVDDAKPGGWRGMMAAATTTTETMAKLWLQVLPHS